MPKKIITKAQQDQLDRIRWGFTSGETDMEQMQRLGISTIAGFNARVKSLVRKELLSKYEYEE